MRPILLALIWRAGSQDLPRGEAEPGYVCKEGGLKCSTRTKKCWLAASCGPPTSVSARSRRIPDGEGRKRARAAQDRLKSRTSTAAARSAGPSERSWPRGVPPKGYVGYFCKEDGLKCHTRTHKCWKRRECAGKAGAPYEARGTVAPPPAVDVDRWWRANATAVKAEVARHSMIFVAGSPNSGTSLLRTLVAQAGLAEGMDRCAETTRCVHTNVEGQWLLKLEGQRFVSPVVADVYRPGNLSNHLTEADAVDADAALVTLWRMWSLYWDMSRAYLVEKSPANVVKLRWLDAVFRPAKRVRFLVTVKSPLTHKGAEAAEAHKTAVKACEVAAHKARMAAYKEQRRRERRPTTTRVARPPSWRRLFGGAPRSRAPPGRVVANRTRAPRGNASECEAAGGGALAEQLAAVEDWARIHEVLAGDLEAWDEAPARVGVVRYERLSLTCPCERIVRFAMPDLPPGDGRLAAACAPFAACRRSRRLNLHNATEGIKFLSDASGLARLRAFRDFLDGGGARTGDPAGWARLVALDARTSALGYSLLEVYAHYDPASPRVTDRWAPWSLTPMAVKAVVERNADTGEDEARLDGGASPGS